MPATKSAKQTNSKEKRSKEKFREISVAEFFAKNKELAGFANPTRALYQTVRELVENSLDATDTHLILPEIVIRIVNRPELSGSNGSEQRFTVIVEDNGIGVPPTVMANAFGRVLFSSKYVIRQTRGMYGLGVKAAVLYGQATAGQPLRVVSATKGSSYSYMKELFIDMKKNEPRIVSEGQWRRRGSWHGTRVAITLMGDWRRAKSRILEYIKRTAIIAPYAEIIFETPEGEIYYFPRLTRKLPRPPREAKPHPHGIDLEHFKIIIKESKAKTLLELLVQEFQSVGEKTARAFLKKIGVNPNLNPKKLLRKENEELLRSIVDEMKKFDGFKPPRSDYLSPLGEDLIKLGLKRLFEPEWVEAVTRPPRAFEGNPFIVEIGMAYGGKIPPMNEPLLLRYANKIPLLYEEKEDISWKVLSSINWKLYLINFPAPLVVLVHIASTKVPYKGVGKESISEIPELEQEIKNGIQEVARRLRAYISRKIREAETLRRITTLAKYIPEIARSLAILSKPPEKWSLPSPDEEKLIMDKMAELIATKVPTAKGSDGKTQTIRAIRSIVESARTE